MHHRRLVTAAAALAVSMAWAGTALASSLIGMVNGSDVFYKSGPNTAPWSALAQGNSSSHLVMYGDRVGYIDGSGNLWLKQGLNGTWYKQTTNVASFALSETGLLVIKTDKSAWYKGGQSPTAQWDSTSMAADVLNVYLSPSQMVIIQGDVSKVLLGKTLAPMNGQPAMGPDASWNTIAMGATAAAVTDDRLVYVDGSGNVRGKMGNINASWWNNGQVITANASQVGLNGTMYCAITFSGVVFDCKPFTFADQPMQVFSGSSISSFSLAPNRIVLRGNDGDGNIDLYGIDFSGVGFDGSQYFLRTSGWKVLSNTGTEVTTNQQ